MVNNRSARSRGHMLAGSQYVFFVRLAGVTDAKNDGAVFIFREPPSREQDDDLLFSI